MDPLWPPPKQVRRTAETVPWPCPVRRVEDASIRDPEGYRLEVGSGEVVIAASSEAGFFYGAKTLEQWTRGRETLPGVLVEDRPDFRHRGFLLDVSRDKVPGAEMLKELVELLASLKYNQLQLYMEHTFAYDGHDEVWRGASPLTPDEVRGLDEHCARHFIELVPNQNSFGHFHRWLRHDRYRPLAETPAGIVHPFSLEPEPFSLCATDPRVPDLLAGLYDQLLPCFRSRQLNAGCDETIELGEGRSAAACAQRGKGRVYLDFLRRVHRLAAERGRRLQIWGDIILQHPELIGELPDDVVVLEWGYEADHPFAENSVRFAEAGREHYVCPGTSSWQSFAGRTANAVVNLASAAVHGRNAGAAGYLVTDWGDHGHLQPWVASLPGLAAGAAFAWNADAAREPLGDPESLPLAEILDTHVFEREGLGRAACDLGNTYRKLDQPPMNASSLFVLVVFALLDQERDKGRTAGVTLEGLERARAWVENASSGLGDGTLHERELRLASAFLTFACDLGRERWASGDLRSFERIPTSRRRALADALRALVAEHRAVSLERYRPGGLDDSAARLERVAAALAGGEATSSARRDGR